MKSKRRILLGAIITVVLCLCIVFGATFALFATETSVDMTITPGTVDVTAKVSSATTYSVVATNSSEGDVVDENGNKYVHEVVTESFVEPQVGAFSNGGTATLDGNTIALERMSAGDKVRVVIDVTNKSSIAVKGRMVLQSNLGDVSSYLKGTVTQKVGDVEGTPTEFNGIETFCSNWQSISYYDPDKSDPSAKIQIILEVELAIDCPLIPSTNQNRGCTVTFTLEATQQNAAVTDGVARIIRPAASSSETELTRAASTEENTILVFTL